MTLRVKAHFYSCLSGSACWPICTDPFGTQNENATLLSVTFCESKLPRTRVAFTHAASLSNSGPGTTVNFGSPLKLSVMATMTHMTDLLSRTDLAARGRP